MSTKLISASETEPLPWHPAAELFPLLEGTEFDELVADIAAGELPVSVAADLAHLDEEEVHEALAHGSSHARQRARQCRERRSQRSAPPHPVDDRWFRPMLLSFKKRPGLATPKEVVAMIKTRGLGEWLEHLPQYIKWLQEILAEARCEDLVE